MAEFTSIDPVVEPDTRFRVTFDLSALELAILSDATRNHCNPANIFDHSVREAVRTAHEAVKASHAAATRY